MNYTKLLSGKSITEAEAISDNWYRRLNKVKAKYGMPYKDPKFGYYEFAIYENKKAQAIVYELGSWCLMVMDLINKARAIKYEDTRSFPSGGVPINN